MSEVYRPLGVLGPMRSLPRGTHGARYNFKIARSLRFEMIQFPAPRLRRPSALGSRENAIESHRLSDLRLRPGLGCWFMTALQGGARGTPELQDPSLWKGASPERNL